VEIASGSMLGPRFKPDHFYMRTSPGSLWKETYSDPQYRGKARGKLMAVSMEQALFDDEWLTEAPFDPEKNTAQAIAALDLYKQHGVLAVTVSLQGTDPGYDQRVNGIARKQDAKFGKQGGALVSAYNPDGSLKAKWMARLEKLLHAADQRGMIVCLIYFHSGQDEVLESKQAVLNAAANITDWLIAKNFRNVIINVAEEWNLEGDTWDHDQFIPRRIANIVDYVRDRFHDADFLPPIGASAGGNMAYPASLARLCDMVLIHGNGQSSQDKIARIQEFEDYDRPVWVTYDNNGHEPTLENLDRELTSAEIMFRNTAGWGYVPWALALQFPFDYLPAESSAFTDGTPLELRQRAYFRAVLEHIANLTLRKPPSSVEKTEQGPDSKTGRGPGGGDASQTAALIRANR
jgi:hypothetical protein